MVCAVSSCGGRIDHLAAYPTVSRTCIENAEANGTTVPEDFGAPPTPDSTPPPLDVPASAIEGKRISGVTQIRPDYETQRAMADAGVVETTASFKLCLDTSGVPTSAMRLSSTCFPRYDETIRTRMLTWRYTPYSVDGLPKEVCTQISYLYSIGKRRKHRG